ncbi:HEPN domain-containing protein [Shewanella algae]|uniref:HEPN domain-containing protein n=1 Tax=Shewanella algae TaxID=38313 RepID=UPI0030040853
MDDVKAIELIKELHKFLLVEISHIYNSYLKKHLNKSLKLDPSWERDKKSLVIFTHAALENYIEMLSQIVIENAHHKYLYNKEINESLLCFIWTRSNSKPVFCEDEWGDTNREALLKNIKELVIAFNNEINKNNHGIKIKNLNTLLRSVGLDFTKNTILSNSWIELTEWRGEFAHRFLERGLQARRIRNEKGPEEVEKIVINCYRLAYRLFISALSRISDEKSKVELLKELATLIKNHSKFSKIQKANSIFNI